MITLIAAVAKNGVIGHGNAIPWHLPEDFKHFKETTKGQAVVMGSKTWDSLPPRFRPLPDRHNYVVTRDEMRRDKEDEKAQAHWVNSLEAAIRLAKAHHEVFIIGGASIYEQSMAMADRLIISEVDLEPEGDTFFPKIGPEWSVSKRDEREGFAIVTFTRVA